MVIIRTDLENAIYGISFDGVSTYMDLGLVPMLNGVGSYMKTNFKATNWDTSQRPFGFVNVTNDRFNMFRNPVVIGDVWNFQGQHMEMPSTYPNSDDYQEMRGDAVAGPIVDISVGGANLVSTAYTPEAISGRPFFLGSLNNLGTPSNFCEVIFTDIEFFNGVDTKTFNDANDWNGATNFGGVRVVSLDGGLTWEPTTPKYETTIAQPSRFITDGSVDLKWQDETIRKEFTDTVAATYAFGVINFDYAFEAIEGRYYYVIVSQGGEEKVKFKMYCTDQTDLQNYTVQDDRFVTAPQSDNSFVVIE